MVGEIELLLALRLLAACGVVARWRARASWWGIRGGRPWRSPETRSTSSSERARRSVV